MQTDTKISTSSVLLSAKQNIANTLPYVSYCTLPILTIQKRATLLIVFIGRGEIVNPEAGYCIWEPDLAAIYSTATGFFEELAGIGNHNVDDQPVGKGISPIEKLDAKYLAKQARYCELNDKLIEALKVPEDCQELKDKVKAAFFDCCEPILHQHFEKLFIR